MENDFGLGEDALAVLREVARDEYRLRRIRRILPIWHIIEKVITPTKLMWTFVGFLVNFGIDTEMKIRHYK